MLNIILDINNSDKDNQMTMEPGIYDISNEAYHQGFGLWHVDYVNNSVNTIQYLYLYNYTYFYM